MYKKLFIILLHLTLVTKFILGQVNGNGTYQFLNLPSSARTTALGGKLVALDESDPSTILQSPSLLDSNMHNNIMLSYVSYFAGIKYASFAYARNYTKIGTFAFGMQRVGYGSFTKTDETGTIQGSFTASEMAIILTYSRTFDTCYTIGIALKPIYSHLDNYTSFGIASDIAGSFRSRNGLFAAGIAFKNIGTMIKTYSPETREPLPLEIIAGISKKLAHAPFRFMLTFHQLQNFNLYYKPETFTDESVFGDKENNSSNFATRLGREFISHIIVGAEFIPIRNFYLRVGYNYQRRNELKIQENTSTVGFSWGLGIKISKFHINYSRSKYHLAGVTNHFTVTTDFSKLFNIK